jgi:hypothetical protein
LLRQHLDNLFFDTIGDDIWFLLIVCVLAVHLYDLRRGALIAGSVYSLSFAIVVCRSCIGTCLASTARTANMSSELI